METGDQIKVGIDTSDGYMLGIEDSGFSVKKSGAVLVQGMFLPAETECNRGRLQHRRRAMQHRFTGRGPGGL